MEGKDLPSADSLFKCLSWDWARPKSGAWNTIHVAGTQALACCLTGCKPTEARITGFGGRTQSLILEVGISPLCWLLKLSSQMEGRRRAENSGPHR